METEKVTVKADKIVAAYQILTSPKTQEKPGIVISSLDTSDIFKVVRATNAFKAVAVAFEDFRRDAAERLRPENWDEIVEKANRFKELSDEDKIAVNKAISDYNRQIDECVASELEKDKEIDAYEHLSEDALGTLIKSNGHVLDVPAILLLNEILG